MKNCDILNTPCINRVVMCTATTCVKPQLEQPSPLTIEINEKLFDSVVRTDSCIRFWDDGIAFYEIHSDGSVDSAHIEFTSKQINEIIRVRAALVWTGKE